MITSRHHPLLSLAPARDHLAERHREAQESLSAAEARAAESEGRASSSLAALAVLNERYRAASKKAKALGKRALHLQEVLKEQVREAGEVYCCDGQIGGQMLNFSHPALSLCPVTLPPHPNG